MATMKKPRVVTIGISGPSCSGKTTLALLLKKLLNKAVVINQDEFFKPDDQIPLDKDTNLANWDSPEAVDFKKLNEAINQARRDPYALLAQKEKVLQNNHHGSDLLSRSDFADILHQIEPLQDTIFILVEGFLLFCDEEVCANLDNKFFVIASQDILRKRRESRPGYKTLNGYWVDPPHYFDQIVYPQFLLWNSHLLNDSTRDPSIKVLVTDHASSKEITSKAVLALKERCHQSLPHQLCEAY